MEDAKILQGGNSSTVVRTGNKVYRSAGPWTPTIHQLLNQLRKRGLAEVPEVFGFDDQDREILAYIDGEVANYPLPAWLWSEIILQQSFALMRRMHDAVAISEINQPVWQNEAHQPQEVICHNDFAPYNMVFQQGQVVGLIDFDNASPGPRIWDFSYLAYRLIPFAEDAGPDAPTSDSQRLDRLNKAITSYGADFDVRDIFKVMATRLDSLADYSENRSQQTGQIELLDHARMYRRDALKVRAMADSSLYSP